MASQTNDSNQVNSDLKKFIEENEANTTGSRMIFADDLINFMEHKILIDPTELHELSSHQQQAFAELYHVIKRNRNGRTSQ